MFGVKLAGISGNHQMSFRKELLVANVKKKVQRNRCLYKCLPSYIVVTCLALRSLVFIFKCSEIFSFHCFPVNIIVIDFFKKDFKNIKTFQINTLLFVCLYFSVYKESSFEINIKFAVFRSSICAD